MDDVLERLEDILQDLVNDTTKLPAEKAQLIRQSVDETALEEFLSWFTDDE